MAIMTDFTLMDPIGTDTTGGENYDGERDKQYRIPIEAQKVRA